MSGLLYKVSLKHGVGFSWALGSFCNACKSEERAILCLFGGKENGREILSVICIHLLRDSVPFGAWKHSCI
jgi:hypothetical protein